MSTRLSASPAPGTTRVTLGLLPVTVSGDVNVAMSPGKGEEIIWNAAAEYRGPHLAQAVAKITLSDESAPAGEMLPVPAGIFTTRAAVSGGELPEHSVTLSAFWFDKHEVTKAEGRRVTAGGRLS